ncbi:endonuclease domain-containing protein [Cnuibacter physcomitrellae]|uniref:endonuclease domain-containing protein n=1 Tax=Cnuibacter physcomitrellae TaxID=1619308 RepID=UPI0021758868|nr:endonuclease domain-containing protein [Cnuibacter physcomitrellae]
MHLTLPSALPREIVFAVDSVPQSVLHAAHCLDRAHAVAALDSILNLGLLSRPALTDLLGGQIGRVAALLPLVDPGAQSGIESLCRLGLHAARIGARSQVQIDDVGRVDFLVGDRLVIEVDGREHHATQAGFAEDRRRDLALAARGYLVLRLTYVQVMYQWGEVLATIRGILRRGEHRWSGRHRRDGLVMGVERYR